ncbi:hypothetical protein MTO96_014049 [Rhipicephalus appendiculatus]
MDRARAPAAAQWRLRDEFGGVRLRCPERRVAALYVRQPIADHRTQQMLPNDTAISRPTSHLNDAGFDIVFNVDLGPQEGAAYCNDTL